jgi:hypothetical protein
LPFDVFFDLAYDQRRVLLENSKLQRIGNAYLFCARLCAPGDLAVEQVASRLCPLPTPFAFLSDQACASNFRPRARGVSRRNSLVVFSCATPKDSV